MRIPLRTFHGVRDELTENTGKTPGLVHAAAGEVNEKSPRYGGELSKIGKAAIPTFPTRPASTRHPSTRNVATR